MLQAIRIRDFKCFKDSQQIQVRPLTFLVGPNSSGKSSILQSILLLRQTIESRDVRNPLTINGPYIKLGSFKELIRMQNPKKGKLRFEFEFSSDGPFLRVPGTRMMGVGRLGGRLAPRLRPRPVFKLGNISVRTEFGYNGKTMQIFLERCEYQLDSNGPRLEIYRAPNGKYRTHFDYPQMEEQIEMRAEFGKPIPVREITKFYGIENLVASPRLSLPRRRFRRDVEEIANIVAHELELLFNRISYIGPLREVPERAYVTTGAAPQDVGLKGEFSVDVLWAQSRKKATREKLVSKVNKWMEQFKIGSTTKLKRIGGNHYSLVFEDPQTGLEVNLVDVGFGASQLLPIVIEGFYSSAGTLMLIEQPEIHLHPGAQTTLGDLLIDISKSANQKVMIVETHSEPMLSRIRRRIADGTISREYVAIYYCQPNPDGTEIIEIELTEDGQYVGKGLPEGFFEESYREALEFMEAISKREPS